MTFMLLGHIGTHSCGRSDVMEDRGASVWATTILAILNSTRLSRGDASTAVTAPPGNGVRSA